MKIKEVISIINKRFISLVILLSLVLMLVELFPPDTKYKYLFWGIYVGGTIFTVCYVWKFLPKKKKGGIKRIN